MTNEVKVAIRVVRDGPVMRAQMIYSDGSVSFEIGSLHKGIWDKCPETVKAWKAMLRAFTKEAAEAIGADLVDFQEILPERN